MSVTQPSGHDGPNPRDDPEAVIHEELGDYRNAIGPNRTESARPEEYPSRGR
jgi:hypothetical protein